MSDTQKQSPVIWRCARCGGLVHVSSERSPAAWCARCGKVTEALRDGG
ncbi:MAG TPA: hypothetical protein VHV57_15085 [Acidimicrobiales bacterium]|nr:hypothetical protein [Acidimicrobiales bacterium]